MEVGGRTKSHGRRIRSGGFATAVFLRRIKVMAAAILPAALEVFSDS
jgi:hypothetical protein